MEKGQTDYINIITDLQTKDKFMLKALLLMLYILSINININAIAEDSIKKEDIVTIFKRSMNHWKINYETLDEINLVLPVIPSE